jgi:putative ABC transport system permease protein
MESHAELLKAEYLRQGMSEPDARDAARRDLGNLTLLREQYRGQSGFPFIDARWQDLKQSLRSLRRNPGFTAFSVGVLGVGLGALATVGCVISALVWRPLPYPNAGRLVTINEVDPRHGLWPFSEPTLVDLTERAKSLDAIAAYQSGTWALTGSGEPETIAGAAVTPSFFQVFGMRAVSGSLFQTAQKRVVISRRLWKRKWQMDSRIAGRVIAFNGDNYTISGVADLPEDLLPGADVLLSLDLSRAGSRSAHEIEAVARLRPDVTAQQAGAELRAIAAGIGRENPITNAAWGMAVSPLFDQVVGPRTSRMLWMMFAAVGLLCLLACINVAGLQMARSIARSHEMGTRLALGASRGRLLGLMLTESTMLAAGGTLLGLTIASWALAAIRWFSISSVPRLAHVEWSPAAFAVAAAGLLISTLLTALLPGQHAQFPGSRGVSRRHRGHDVLIAAQVALASVLVLSATLLLQSFLRLRAVNPGFDPERILSVRINLPERGYDNPRKTAFFRDVSEGLHRLPRVEAAGATNVEPFSGIGTANRFRVEGEPASAEYRSASWRAVTPGFFRAMGIPLKAGRLFSDADKNGSLEVVILSESMAKRFWPNQDPLGKRLLWGRSQHPKTIVGIVGDVRDLNLDTPPAPTMFRPYSQLSDRVMTEVIRMKGDPAAAVSDVRRAIWNADPNAALEFKPLRRALVDSTLRPRASLAVVMAFALVAIVIASFGLYGLITYRVNQSRQEIGIRLALGAPASLVRWNIQKRALLLVFCGLLIGLPVTYTLSKFIASLLYETHPVQAGAYVVVLIVFLGIALAASGAPSRRAARMDPVAAIRHE